MTEPTAKGTRSLARTGAHEPVHPVRLRVTEGPDLGREVVVEGGTARVGSGAECELQLRDETISRQHLAIELLDAKVRVRDLGSKNGTRYLGARIDSAVVPIGVTLELGKTRLAILPLQLAPSTLSDKTELAGLLGRSVPMRRLFAELEQVAPTDAPVLVLGESGTGKERIARALHALSNRAGGPLEFLDGSSVQPDLLPGELFGHARGAFTGALRDRPGALERAHGGTLVLDEIGELPLDLQPLLLRALEAREVTRLGEGKVRRVDFRLVCLTHQNLEERVAAGKFRLDLFHRLPSIVLRAPPLRERREDIELLVEHFARELKKDFRLEAAELALLQAHTWPGNVRELRNSVERMVATRALPLPAASRELEANESFQDARARVLQTFEKAYLEALLAKHQGSAAAAARASGLAKSYFYKLLALHGLPSSRR